MAWQGAAEKRLGEAMDSLWSVVVVETPPLQKIPKAWCRVAVRALPLPEEHVRAHQASQQHVDVAGGLRRLIIEFRNIQRRVGAASGGEQKVLLGRSQRRDAGLIEVTV